MQPKAQWFTDWFNSPYYHKLYFERDDREAEAFIQDLLNWLRPEPQSRMLDVACGKGRHSRMLAVAGFDVTGIDLSPDSIRHALQFESENLHFFQHDMRLPFHINFFNYAFNFFTSFGYFKTEREHYNALRSMVQSLKKDGILVIDYLNVHYAEDHLVHRTEKMVDEVNYLITKWYDETHFYKKIVVEDEALQEPLVYTERVAKFNLGDFNEMLSFHGMQIRDVFGDYALGPYDVRKSPRMILVAVKTQ
jgi:SAM-dependent methyltransferase